MIKNNHGFALLPMLILLPFLVTIGFIFLANSTSSLRLADDDRMRSLAQFAADAGVDYALQEINQDNAWTGTSTPVDVQDSGIYTSSFSINIQDSGDNKIIYSTGTGRKAVGLVDESVERKVQVEIRPVESLEGYSVVTGVGGLRMSNSAQVFGGDVFVNGTIEMSNSAKIGLIVDAIDVYVAHQSCPNPPDATYPRICNPGENGEPITINNTAHIYANVRANNQTTTSGMSTPGLTASSGVAALSLPPHNRNAQKAAVAVERSGSDAGCSSGTKVWQANTKINGDVVVRNNCTVDIRGDVWITGNLEVRNSGRIVVSDVLGTTRANVMVDGTTGVEMRNNAQIVSNFQDTGLQFITYHSAAACSPDCANVTGQDLKDGLDMTTIFIQQSASGPETVFYARWSEVVLENSAGIGALVGQTVTLQNSGSISFGSTVGGTELTNWVIDNYKRDY